MSRIGKQSIVISAGVTVQVTDDRLIIVKGAKGELTRTFHPDVNVQVANGAVAVSLSEHGSKKAASIWGLTRTLIANMVTGVTTGFEKTLEFEGIGYRVALEGSALLMQLGFSHPIRFEAPKGITFAVQKNIITISGIDKELVGQIAARIRALKRPEPYKGKGIRYRGEIIRRKSGKKAVTSGG